MCPPLAWSLYGNPRTEVARTGAQNRILDPVADRGGFGPFWRVECDPGAAGLGWILTPERHVWACAAAVEKQHGERAPLFVAERIGSLAVAGDTAGVEMWRAIAARLADLMADGNKPPIS